MRGNPDNVTFVKTKWELFQLPKYYKILFSLNFLFFSLSAALREYQKVNKTLPDKIIMYRDGVGDGQLQMVIEHEVSQLIQCFKTISEQYK